MTYRDVIREVVREMAEVDDSKSLARAAVERMSEEERYSALMTFLPSLVRRLHNDTVRSAAEQEGALPLEERVFVQGRDTRLGDMAVHEHAAIEASRSALSDGFRRSAVRFRAFRDALTQTETESLRVLEEAHPLKAADLAKECRRLRRSVEALRNMAGHLLPVVEDHERRQVSPRVEMLTRAIADERALIAQQQERLRTFKYVISVFSDPSHAGSLATLPLIPKVKELLDA